MPVRPSILSYTFDKKEENLEESIKDLLSEYSISVDPSYGNRGRLPSNQQRKSKVTPGAGGQGT